MRSPQHCRLGGRERGGLPAAVAVGTGAGEHGEDVANEADGLVAVPDERQREEHGLEAVAETAVAQHADAAAAARAQHVAVGARWERAASATRRRRAGRQGGRT